MCLARLQLGVGAVNTLIDLTFVFALSLAFLAISMKTIEWFKKNLVDYCGEDEEKLDGVRRGNVVRLFESHGIDIRSPQA